MQSTSHGASSTSAQPTDSLSTDRSLSNQILETRRLLLIGATEAMLNADRTGRRVVDICGAAFPAGWPPEHWDDHALDYLAERMRRYPSATGWCRYIALKRQGDAPPLLIGTCGCTEPPATVDEVEIGYSILPEFYRQGYCTEAVQALLPWIFAYRNVQSICAQTYPHLLASIGVLRKCGFIQDGTGKEPGTILFRRMRS